jgi:hypothetical protein
MKRVVVSALLATLASEAGAVVIDAPGLYVIDSAVDELIVDSSLNTADVSIRVVSGGVVQNNVVCSGGDSNCNFRVTVSGNGSILGRVRGEGALIDLRDNANVGHAGTQRSADGKLIVGDNVHLGTISGAGSGTNGMWEIRGGVIDNVVSFPNALAMYMSGGIINDTVDAWGMSFDFRGGDINGDLMTEYGPMSLRMRDGHISGDLIQNDMGLQGFMEGGAIDGNLRARGLGGGVFDIFGGQFGGGDPDSLWWLGGAQIMNVHGRGLVLTDGRLTGYLLDGSRLDVGVNFSDFYRGQLNIYNVPEPGTLALFGAGLLAAFAARRKVKAAR